MTELFEGIRSPTTKRKYELRIRQFLARVYGDKRLGTPNRQGKLLSKQEEEAKDKLTRQYAKKFLARARAEPEWATGAINDFLNEIKARVGTTYNSITGRSYSYSSKSEPSSIPFYLQATICTQE